MLEMIQNMAIVICEVLCCVTFLGAFGKKRHERRIWDVQIVFLCVFTFALAHLLNRHFFIKHIMVILAITIFSYGYYVIGILQAIILSIICIASLGAIDYLTIAICNTLFTSDILNSNHSGEMLYLIVLLDKAIALLFAYTIKQCFQNKEIKNLPIKELLKIVVIPVFSITVIGAMISSFGFVKEDGQVTVLYSIAFGMIGMNIYVFYLISNIVKKEAMERGNQRFRMEMQNQANIYQSISKNYEMQKRNAHEYKNNLLCIESLLSQKQYTKLEEYVKEIYGTLCTTTEWINTNNIIVNTIINIKYQEAVEKNIIFIFKGNDLSDLKICDNEIVTLLTNLLNNAIEACETCNSQKVIKCKFVKEDNRIIISVKNTYSHPIQSINGEICTSKAEHAEEHGIGIKNIKKIVEDNNGSYVIKYDDKEFSFSIMIPA